MARQTTITIETTSLLMLHSRNCKRAWCRECGAESEMFALEKGDLPTRLATAFEKWINSGEMHHAELPDGSSLICLNSLLALVQNTNSANRGIPRLPSTETEKEKK
jgi:hypothetical protein